VTMDSRRPASTGTTTEAVSLGHDECPPCDSPQADNVSLG